MKKSDTPGVTADYGGEVTVKRPSPLPLMPGGSMRFTESDTQLW
jgi:hypothetical protein